MTPPLPKNAYTGDLLAQFAALPATWRSAMQAPQVALALNTLEHFLRQRLTDGATIFPADPFRALQDVHPEKIRVVILGQDPYHGPGQAQGLAFSVPETCPCPPSLRNIFTELQREYPDRLTVQSHDLTRWVTQGVLLLNTVLTVEAGQAAAHARRGWETVTDALISYVAHCPQPKVFMLWGTHAQQKRLLIPHTDNNLVLCANHPSPLSARRPPAPFIGCNHFVNANQWLLAHGQSAIDW